MSIPQRSKLLLSLRQWKAKAITRREQVEALKKRQGELILSRETWKRTAQAHHDTIAELQATVKHLQAEVTSHQTHVTDCQAECCDLRTQVAELHAENRRFTPSAEAEKKRRPARYRHSIQTIQTLVAFKLRTSSSFRAVAKSSHILQEYQTSSLETADPTTIIRWVRKLGYYALTRPKPVADDWIILLDHSVRLGAEKLCVILGLRESLLDLSRPLVYADLEPLWMSASAQWNGPFVRDVVERLQGRLGRIKYAVGDYGSDIRTGLRLAEIPHIHDVTHRIALSLKHVYVDDPIYREVSQRFARIRRHFWLPVAGPLLPFQG